MVEDELTAMKDVLWQTLNMTLQPPNISAIVKGGLGCLNNSFDFIWSMKCLWRIS